MRALGVDPGHSAGAALLDDQAVLWWWAWTRVVAGYRVTSPGGRVVVSSMYQVGRLVALGVEAPCRVAVEGLYVSQARGRAAAGRRQGTLDCAEQAGELMGPLRHLGTIQRPTWQTWAMDVLGISTQVGSRHADELMVQEARRRYHWPEGPRLTLGEELATCEAAHIARWVIDYGREAT